MESFWTQSSSTTFGMLRAMALEKLDNTAFTTGEYVSNLAPVTENALGSKVQASIHTTAASAIGGIVFLVN